MDKKKNIALVLSTGGARGIAHIGVIEELERQGYHITSIAGCSMGALIGAAYATGRLQACKEALLLLNKPSLLKLMDITVSRSGFLKGNKLMRRIAEIIPDVRIEELKIPFTAVATDLQTEQEVVFRKGKLLDAVRASISLPNLFQPFKWNGSFLVDGGLSAPLPLEYVHREADDLLVASVAYSLHSNDKPFLLKPDRYFFMSQPTTILVQKNISHTIARFHPDMVIRSETRPFTIFQFDKGKELIANSSMQPIDWNNHDESIRTVRQAYFFVSNEQKKRKSSPLARLSISASRSSSNRSRVAEHSPQISTPITCSCRSTTASNCSSSGRLREPWSQLVTAEDGFNTSLSMEI